MTCDSWHMPHDFFIYFPQYFFKCKEKKVLSSTQVKRFSVSSGRAGCHFWLTAAIGWQPLLVASYFWIVATFCLHASPSKSGWTWRVQEIHFCGTLRDNQSIFLPRDHGLCTRSSPGSAHESRPPHQGSILCTLYMIHQIC